MIKSRNNKCFNIIIIWKNSYHGILQMSLNLLKIPRCNILNSTLQQTITILIDTVTKTIQFLYEYIVFGITIISKIGNLM